MGVLIARPPRAVERVLEHEGAEPVREERRREAQAHREALVAGGREHPRREPLVERDVAPGRPT